jgi:hypothetical protein
MIGLPDMIVAGMVLEGAALLTLRAFTGRGPKALIANLMSGGCLLLAWRASEADASAVTICALLAAALLAHALDLAQRWREPAPETRISSASVSVRASRRAAP